MKKIFFCLVLVIFSVFIITGCGNKLEEYAGTYKLEYFKYVGDPETAKVDDEIADIVLNGDGTGKSNRDGLNIDIEWQLDGENITLTEIYMGVKLEYNGTLKNGKLNLFNGNKNDDLTVEKVYNKE